MSRVNDQLYINIGTDNRGCAVLTVYRITSSGHIIVNELHGREAVISYNMLVKERQRFI